MLFHRKEFFSHCGQALEQVAHRSCGCPIPGNAQDQAGYGLQQPGLVDGVPWHRGWNQMIFKDPSNPNVSVILKFVLFHLTKYMWKKKKKKDCLIFTFLLLRKQKFLVLSSLSTKIKVCFLDNAIIIRSSFFLQGSKTLAADSMAC